MIAALCLILFRGRKNQANDPNLGTWVAVSGEVSGFSTPVSELFEQGFTIELKNRGKCRLVVDGVKASGKWSLDGTDFHIKSVGLECDGTLEGEVLVLENIMGADMNLTFTKDGRPLEEVMPADTENGGEKDTDGADHGAETASDSDAGIYLLKQVVSSGEDGAGVVTADDLEELGADPSYLELREDGTGELFFVDELYELKWTEGELTLFGEASPYLLQDGILSFTFEGDEYQFTRTDKKPEVQVLPDTDDEDEDWDSFEERPNPASLHNTVWYGWIRYYDYWGRSDKKNVDTDTYDCWGYVGTNQDSGREYFELYQDGEPETPLISMWADVENDAIYPVIDDEAWFRDSAITEDQALYLTLYPYDGALSMWGYPYESPDGKWGCNISFYMRIDGEEWDEELDLLPPRYDEYKEALAQ